MNKVSNPIIMARETLRQLTALKIPPTPDNYHKFYDKISGSNSDVMCDSTRNILTELAKEFPRDTPELASYADTLKLAVKVKNWHKYQASVSGVFDILNKTTESEPAIAWADTIKLLLKQLERKRGTLTLARKREGLNRVLNGFSKDSTQLNTKLHALMESWEVLESADAAQTEIEVIEAEEPIHSIALTNEVLQTSVSIHNEQHQASAVEQLQELLAYILEHIAAIQIGDVTLLEEAKLLAKQVRLIQNEQELIQFISVVKQFCVKVESCGEHGIKLQQGLLGLLNSFMDSTEGLLAGDQWIKNQIAKLRETMSHPLDLQVVEQADFYLKELLHKQDVIKQNLSEAQVAMKQMVTSLIENIEGLSTATGDYHDKIGFCSEKIKQADDIESLNQFLVELMDETKIMQASALSSRSDFLAARVEVDAAQNKISQLESELLEMGEKVQEDHLTGTLNRRGLNNAFERETSRANRQKKPLCLAVLDIDNFKQLNDTYGHVVGDDALVYLVEVIKDVTRSEDIVARFGGEEFIILLPDTGLEGSVSLLTRIKRNLTRKFFLYENKRLLITFSAGVAEYHTGETEEELVKRADEAMYRAKNSGKNQVLAASN